MDSAVASLEGKLDEPEEGQVRRLVNASSNAAAIQWKAFVAGRPGAASQPRAQRTGLTPQEEVASRNGSQMPLGELDSLADSSDDELSGREVRLSVGNLQRQLSVLVDNTKLRRRVTSLESAGRYPDMRRLAELRDPSADHTWIQRMDFC